MAFRKFYHVLLVVWEDPNLFTTLPWRMFRAPEECYSCNPEVDHGYSTDPPVKLSSNKITRKMETPEQSCRELKRKLGAFLNNIECMLLWQQLL